MCDIIRHLKHVEISLHVYTSIALSKIYYKTLQRFKNIARLKCQDFDI